MSQLTWPLPDRIELRDRLIAAYSTDRGYHDLRHLTEVLDRIGELGGSGNTELVLAAWFHDAVYLGAGDDEEQSALLAERELANDDVDSAEVARLVRLTTEHKPSDGDLPGQILCDADLGILAADRARYTEYTDGVRRDYSFVADEDFRAGRRAVLEDLLGREKLFRTEIANRLWDLRARENLAEEIAALS